MNDEQLLRYSRHILLSQIDIKGQNRIMAGKVLVVGAGGLGCPAAMYLASAGVGSLTICDGDEVDLTNLQRQILHRQDRIGMNKALSAKVELATVNPDCNVIAIPERLGPDELDALVKANDIVVEASDNFATRHAVNRACVRHRRPLVSGAAIRFAGQLTTFDARQESSPCYNCLFPSGTPVTEERCAATGVLAPLTGVIGSMQAVEVLNLLVHGTSQMVGRLLLFDAFATQCQEMTFQRAPGCEVCGSPGD